MARRVSTPITNLPLEACMPYTYHIISRSQHAKHNRRGFHGPDQKVLVLGVPEGVEWPLDRPLVEAHMRRVGVRTWWQGEGYSLSCGPKSMLGAAYREARQAVRDFYSEDRGGAGDPYRHTGEEVD